MEFEGILLEIIEYCHKYLKPGNKFIIYYVPMSDDRINISIHSGLDNDNYDDINNYHNQSKIVVKNLKIIKKYDNISLSYGSLDIWAYSKQYIIYSNVA